MKKEILLSALAYILDWYDLHGRHTLPWRERGAHISLSDRTYRVWLSEILLQQTQVVRVIPYFQRILTDFPTMYDLAQASYEDFFLYYKGMGYYSRARNILRTAQIITTGYGGVFPRESRELQKLPGIGKYTSEAIRAFAYDIPTLAWDTNLEKIFSRMLHGSRFIRLSESEKDEIQKILFSGSDRSAFAINSALMDWANCVDLNQKSQIPWEIYMPYGVFTSTQGESEENIQKIASRFPLPDAFIIVILHRDHRVYFSDSYRVSPDFSLSDGILPGGLSGYTPFILTPSLSRDVRGVVQTFFRDSYGLEVSVRPVHKKGYNQDFYPYCIVNAQIQSGVYNFSEFQKK